MPNMTRPTGDLTWPGSKRRWWSVLCWSLEWSAGEKCWDMYQSAWRHGLSSVLSSLTQIINEESRCQSDWASSKRIVQRKRWLYLSGLLKYPEHTSFIEETTSLENVDCLYGSVRLLGLQKRSCSFAANWQQFWCAVCWLSFQNIADDKELLKGWWRAVSL